MGLWVWWWARGSGGFCGVLTDKSPTLRGPTCQGVLGLVWMAACFRSIVPALLFQCNVNLLRVKGGRKGF